MKKVVLLGLFLIAGIVIGMSFNNQVDVLNDDNVFPILLEEINNAETSVHLIVFEMNYYDNYPDSQSNLLIRALTRAQDRGVEVKIVTDGILFDHKENYDYLKSLGLDVKSDISEEVTHNKLIIIDGKKVFVGSSNWSYHSLVKNHESNVLITDKGIAGEFEDYFQEVWNGYN